MGLESQPPRSTTLPHIIGNGLSAILVKRVLAARNSPLKADNTAE